MKKIRLSLLLLLLLTGIATPTLAQEVVPDPTLPQNRYKFAAGGSYTAIKGDELAIKAKVFLSRNFGMEAHAGNMTESGADFYQMYLALLWQPHLQAQAGIRPYIGIGPAYLQISTGSYASINYPPYMDRDNPFMGMIPFGLEYDLGALPLAVSLDCKFPFRNLNRAYINRSQDFITAGLGLKFVIR